MPKELNDNLYYRVKQSGLKMNYLASKLGLSRKGLYLKLKGKIRLRQDEIQAIEDLLNKIGGGDYDK